MYLLEGSWVRILFFAQVVRESWTVAVLIAFRPSGSTVDRITEQLESVE